MTRLNRLVFGVLLMAGVAEAAEPDPAAQGFRAEGLTEPTATKGTAVTVRFEGKPYGMTFRLPWIAGYLTERNVVCAQGYAETFDRKHCEGCAEICQDRKSRYARMWIESRHAARIRVRTRGALCDHRGVIAHADLPSGSPYGKGDWVDERFTIYPDSTCVRAVTIYTGLAPKAAASWGRDGHPFETQETILLNGDGRPPTEDIDVQAVTLIRMDGRSRTIAYKPYPPAGPLFPGANIQVVNLTSKHKPFTIVQDKDVTISPYYGPAEDRRHLEERVFVGWPRGRTWGKHYNVALTHVVDWAFHARTENTLTQAYLLGMTEVDTEEAKVRALLPLARSWLKPPDVTVAGDGCRSEGYDRKQKAYVIVREPRAKGRPVAVRILGSEASPLVNPALVVRGWGDRPPVIRCEAASEIRRGREGTDLVVWLRMRETKPVSLVIR